MGNIINSGYFKDMFEDAQTEETTFCDNSIVTRPRTPLPIHRHRQLLKDPRSPTDDVLRTPIEVACYSQNLASSTILSKLDPRSPSIGILRTPIQVLDVALPQEEAKPYMETDLDELLNKDENNVEGLMAEIQLLAVNLDLDQSGFVASPAAAEIPTRMLIEDALASSEELDVPLLKLAPIISGELASPSMVNFNDKKVTETPLGRKGIRKRNNQENGLILKQQLSRSDKLPTTAKVRTPLGTVSSHNQSPLQIVRGKQCRVLSQMQPTSNIAGEQGGTMFGN